MSDFQAASEDSSGGIADPPPEGLNLDIECLVDSFVAAGCLSLFKLAEAPGRSKDTFSTIHRGDGCGKPLSQTFSFGGTIRLMPTGNLLGQETVTRNTRPQLSELTSNGLNPLFTTRFARSRVALDSSGLHN